MVKRAETHPETFIEELDEINVLLAGGIVYGPFKINRYRSASITLKNLQAGGGETITARVFVSDHAVPDTCVHGGTHNNWAQLGSDLSLAPGDSEVYSWTTPVLWLCVTAEITTADTADALNISVLGKP
jgi:hypothetical protein